MKVFVAGGVKALVYGNLQRNLAVHGIHIIGFSATIEPFPYNGFPVGTEGVIIVKDMIGHDMRNPVVADAKAAGIKYALIERKWSKAKEGLVTTGFITKATDPKAKILPTDTKAVLDFILELRKGPGPTGAGSSSRTPSFPELQSRFPSLTTGEYQVAVSLANKHTGTIVEVPDFEITASIGLTLEHNYDALTSAAKLVELARVEFPELADFFTIHRATATIEDARAVWRLDPQLRMAATKEWAKQRFRRFQKEGKGWILFNDNRDVIKPLFGAAVDWDLICDARAEVYGPWARKLKFPNPCLKEFQDLHHIMNPNTTVDDVLRAIDEGKLKGIKVPRENHGVLGYFTSVEAMEEWFGMAPVETPVVEEPLEAVATEVTEGPFFGFEAEHVLEPVPQAEPAKPFDAVELAELIEAGLKGILRSFAADIGQKLGALQADAVEAGAARDAAHNTMTAIAGLTTAVTGLNATVKQLSDDVVLIANEVRSLKEQRDAAKADPAAVKALAIGHSVLAAKGAEVRIVYGDLKP